MSTFVARMAGAALLKAPIYEEVESDRSATMQAAGVVVLSSLAAGIGAVGPPLSVGPLLTFSLLALGLWGIWAILTLQIGTLLLPAARTEADTGQLLRTIGFATAPGIARIAAVIPGARSFVFAVTAVWMLMAMLVAVRQALDYTSTFRAFAVCLIGWLLAVGIAIIISLALSPTVQ